MDVQKVKGCCHDEVKTFKLQQDLSQAFTLQFKLDLPAMAVSASNYFFKQRETTSVSLNNLHHIPPLRGSETYLFNCVFRI